VRVEEDGRERVGVSGAKTWGSGGGRGDLSVDAPDHLVSVDVNLFVVRSARHACLQMHLLARESLTVVNFLPHLTNSVTALPAAIWDEAS
jgi:hypothetical protein